ncbi:MAG: perosamine synthetase, partial [Actinobacteria bacterium]|nr:perosamine synthetase [Actinomycetota bacterium]
IEGRVAGTWGDVGVVSFGGSKLLSAGRGGAIFTAREALHQRAKIYCERGNHAFPLSELQAAVVTPQLERLTDRNVQRQRAAQRLCDRLADLVCLRPLDNGPLACQPGYYKLGWQYDDARGAPNSRDDFTTALRAEGVALDPGFRGFALRSSQRCRVAGQLDESRRAARAMCVLHHPALLESEATLDRIARAIEKISRWAAAGRTLRPDPPPAP